MKTCYSIALWNGQIVAFQGRCAGNPIRQHMTKPVQSGAIKAPTLSSEFRGV